jgi:hypothetical protein
MSAGEVKFSCNDRVRAHGPPRGIVSVLSRAVGLSIRFDEHVATNFA